MQLAGQLMEAFGCLPLAAPRLGLELHPAFAEQVARFPLGVLRDVLRFLRGGLRDVAAAVGSWRRPAS